MQRDSERFPPVQADIVFVSSDGVRYGLHSKNLECNTGGFPAITALLKEDGDPVTLEEPSSVLDLLFAFAYPDRLPLLEDMDYGTVIRLAEAAEKYQVYSAIYACRMCLRHRRDFIQTHPIEIALFSAKHDYEDILDLTSKQAVRLPLSTIYPLLPQRMIMPWIKYSEAYRQIVSSFPQLVAEQDHSIRTTLGFYNAQHQLECATWAKVSLALSTNYGAQGSFTASDIDALLHLNFSVDDRSCCKSSLERIRKVLEEKFSGLKSFAQFIRENY
ncbi:hypothetical protein NMY22_g13236 [Coprinellus aureogranulatus]|nr:hypothetical protein NMY22_g13236 [Coprinellus aureogranulatus]